MTKKHYHHGNLRDEILIKAAEIIGESGIEALSLRAIARDLGVSHGAPNRHFKNKAELLSALGTEAWFQARNSTIAMADATQSDDPHIRLNAMGRGFLKWALNNGNFLAVIQHPDIELYESPALIDAMEDFRSLLRREVEATQLAGRHPDVDLELLLLFTNSVPYGLAALMRQSWMALDNSSVDEDEVIAQLIELVVPIASLSN